MKNLVFILFVVFASSLPAQKNELHYPITCKDSIIVDNICLDCAEDFCFGGASFLEKYLDVKLYLLLKKGKLTTSNILIAINIDTFGVAKSVNFISKDTVCDLCNELIIEAIRGLKRWKPDCFFSFEISENRVMCQDKTIFLHTKIIGSNIYINGKRERPLRFKY